MTIRMVAGAALLALGLAPVGAKAQLQPGMRTMIQQGGIEPGPLLGAVLPGYGYAPGFGFIPDDVAYHDPRWHGPGYAPHPIQARGRGWTGRRHARGRHAYRPAHATRHHFVR